MQGCLDDFMRSTILKKLSGGDLRSIGRSNAVAREALRDPQVFAELMNGITSDDPLLRMRCSDALEKASAVKPGMLDQYKKIIIDEMSGIDQQEVRWHFAQMVVRLDLSKSEKKQVIRFLKSFLDDNSRIVQVFALQALADLAVKDEMLRKELLPILQDMMESSSPSIRARSRKIFNQFLMDQ